LFVSVFKESTSIKVYNAKAKKEEKKKVSNGDTINSTTTERGERKKVCVHN